MMTIRPRSKSRLFSWSTTIFWAKNFIAASFMTRRQSTFLQVTVMMLNHKNGYTSFSVSDVMVAGKCTRGKNMSMYLRKVLRSSTASKGFGWYMQGGMEGGPFGVANGSG